MASPNSGATLKICKFGKSCSGCGIVSVTIILSTGAFRRFSTALPQKTPCVAPIGQFLYGAAFEGERIRKEDTQIEFGGNKTTAFEYVTSVDFDAISDGEIELIGPDVTDMPEGSQLPLGIWVEVAGRKMQSDFEPILERQIHHLVNGAEGIWHMGQRDIVWTRISKNGYKKGLRIKDYGEIIHAKFMSECPALVDKVKVHYGQRGMRKARGHCPRDV